MSAERWFLTVAERDNPHTVIDRRHGDGLPWTRGNQVRAHIDGADYFAALRREVDLLEAGDSLFFTDWRGDPDEALGADGRAVADVFADAARRGVIVKGLFWRSHWDKLSYSEEENRTLADDVNKAGGEVLLDMRVRTLGSHNQKFVVLRHPGRPHLDVAFAGGIDLCHTRNDTSAHHGDPQAVRMGKVWGPTPPWHDAHIELRGSAVGDIEATFRERWDDPARLVRHPVARIDSAIHRDHTRPGPLPPVLPDPPEQGDACVQVLRTYPYRHPQYPFAPRGERSIARAYDKALKLAESLVYIEDQYFWSGEVVSCFAQALRRNPRLRLIVVLAHYASQDGAIGAASDLVARTEAIDEVVAAGGERVAVYGLENEAGTPIYVHAKVCVVDDVWCTIGSDNVNRRSWTHDSELTCAVYDNNHDVREPRVVDGFGEGARRFPRDLRLQLAREHLGRAEGEDADLVDPTSAFEAFRRTAADLQAWIDAGQIGPRPPGRVRPYVSPRYRGAEKAVAELVYRVAADPDGRPPGMRGTDRF